MRKGRRRRPVSLRGWWRALPFLALAGVTHFAFTWTESKRLHSAYSVNELKSAIEHTHDRITELKGKNYELGSMKRMDGLAPKQDLIPAKPGQIVDVRPANADLLAFEAWTRPAPAPVRLTRSVIILLENADMKSPAATNNSAMAQVDSAPRTASPEKL